MYASIRVYRIPLSFRTELYTVMRKKKGMNDFFKHMHLSQNFPDFQTTVQIHITFIIKNAFVWINLFIDTSDQQMFYGNVQPLNNTSAKVYSGFKVNYSSWNDTKKIVRAKEFFCSLFTFVRATYHMILKGTEMYFCELLCLQLAERLLTIPVTFSVA